MLLTIAQSLSSLFFFNAMKVVFFKYSQMQTKFELAMVYVSTLNLLLSLLTNNVTVAETRCSNKQVAKNSSYVISDLISLHLSSCKNSSSFICLYLIKEKEVD